MSVSAPVTIEPEDPAVADPGPAPTPTRRRRLSLAPLIGRGRVAAGSPAPEPARPVAVPPPPAPAARDAAVTHSAAARRWMRVLVAAVGVLLTAVIAAPIALSSQDLVSWAGAPDGLGLSGPWPVLVFVALDAAAAACVGMVVYAAWRGESGGAFGVLVWAFALVSAFANYRHGSRPDAPADAWWFFPGMSLAGPVLLEVTVRRVRRWVQTAAGRYERPLPHFRAARFLPGVAMRETVRALVLAVTEGYSRPDDAIAAARAHRLGWRPGVTDSESAGVAELPPAPAAELPAAIERGDQVVTEPAAIEPPARRPRPSGGAVALVHRPPARLTARVLAAAPAADAPKRAHLLWALDATRGSVPAALRVLAERGVPVDKGYAYRVVRAAAAAGVADSETPGVVATGGRQ